MIHITLVKKIFETKPEGTRNLERAILRCLEDEDNDLGEQKLNRLRQNPIFYREK
jgi:hypothetical protein